MNATVITKTFDSTSVADALNRAVDDIVDAVDLEDDSVFRDTLHLLVNAGLFYLHTPGADLGQAIEANYTEAPIAVLGSITGD